MSDETRVRINTERVEPMERFAALCGCGIDHPRRGRNNARRQGGHGLNPGQTNEELAAGFAQYANDARTGAALLGAAFCWFSLAFTVVLAVALIPIGPAGGIGLAGGIWVVVASLVLAFQRVPPVRIAPS
ncbi:hypothetical protein ACGFIF_06105 [Kribbella sp. NPDC049174]|uniref:hypothetical protein n=1 Tax=Kribbella sp. NPDC049174 TaxID=3364112 RepID=UPI0037247E3B